MADYLYPENYYIILIHGAYDVPGRASDNLDMDDASDYVYEFILCSICPVKLDKPGLCYNVSHNTIENRVQDWVVGAPENGFLFPAFTDRNTDIHNLLYFTKNAEMDQPDFLDHFLGCQAPLSAKSQKETFQSIIEETLDSACDFSTVMTIQENLNTMIEERKDDPEPVVLDKNVCSPAAAYRMNSLTSSTRSTNPLRMRKQASLPRTWPVHGTTRSAPRMLSSKSARKRPSSSKPVRSTEHRIF